MKPTIADAIISLGYKKFKIEGSPNNENDFNQMFHCIIREDDIGSAIYGDCDLTWEKVQNKLIELETEWGKKEYTEMRKKEYPSIGDQLDALFHAGVFPPEMAAQIQAIKDKYPKPLDT